MSPREIADTAELPYVNVRQLLVRMHKAGEARGAALEYWRHRDGKLVRIE
jgi:hypothetical protein